MARPMGGGTAFPTCLQAKALVILLWKPVFRIRIHVFFGLPDPDPLVRGMDPDPDTSIIMQK
jgi:hypothetical protein